MSSVSRRSFLQRAAGATAAAAAATLVPRNLRANPMGLPIGIQLYMVSEPLNQDTAGTLKQLHAIGFREVETAGTAKVSAKEFRTLLDDAGLACPSAHLQGTDFEEQFAEAHALGAHYVVTSVLPPSHQGAANPYSGHMGLDRFKDMAAQMNEIGKKAHAAGLQYAYHNHNLEFQKMPDGTAYAGAPGYDVLVRETDPALVKFEIDCGWMVVAGADPVAYFRKYPGRFRMLHIKDFHPVPKPSIDLSGTGRPQGTDLGTGFVDYKPIFAAGKAAGIEHIFVEQETPYAVSRMASAKADFAFVQKFS